MRKNQDILKTELESLYSPPPPERKEEFLQNLSYPQISFWEFLRIQFFYIGKMVWVGYLVLFFAGVFLGKFLMDKGFSRGMMAAFCAVLPFVAALLASEVSKSVRFGMQELEMSARHRLEQVVLARLFLLSGAASLLIIAGCLFISWNSVAGVIPCIFYLTVPLLFNSVSSLWICRQIPSTEASGCKPWDGSGDGRYSHLGYGENELDVRRGIFGFLDGNVIGFGSDTGKTNEKI